MCYGTESDRFEALKDADYKEGGSWQQFGEKENILAAALEERKKGERKRGAEKKRRTCNFLNGSGRSCGHDQLITMADKWIL